MARSPKNSKVSVPQGPAPSSATFPFPPWFAAGLLGLVTCVLFWPATGCDFTNLDDPEYLTANVHVQAGLTWESIRWAFVNPLAGNWHPLTMLSHMLDCQLFGLKPWGHHLTSVLLHAVNTALVFLVFRRMTGAFWRSLFVAALFGWHPLRVESVAWVAERKDVLSTLFWLLTLWAYIGYVQPAVRRRSDRPASIFQLSSSSSYWLALGFFALGLMSKPMLVTLPCVLLLLDYWPLNRASDGNWPASLLNRHAALLKEKLPFFALAAAASVVTFLVQRHGGAVIEITGLSFEARTANAVISYCNYLGKIFWPTRLSIFYPHPGGWPAGWVILAGGFLAGVSALVVTQRKRRPYLLVGWLWFLGVLVPVIGLVQVGEQAMADRYTYIPSLGVLIMVIWGVCELARHLPAGRMVSATAGSIAVGAGMLLVSHQLAHWKDSETLSRQALAVTTGNYFAHKMLGIALAAKGELPEAIENYQEAIRLKPNDANARYNLGTALQAGGRPAQAISAYQEAVRLKPDYVEANNNLGALLHAAGRLDEAIHCYQEVLRVAPDSAFTRVNLGSALAARGQADDAIAQFQEALRLNPDDSEVRGYLARAQALKVKTDKNPPRDESH